MDDKWNLDRKPTAAERAIGVAGALLLFAVGAAGFWFSTFVKKNLTVSLVTGAFTVLSMWFLFRLIFTAGRKLQRHGILSMAVVFTVVGSSMLVGSFFAPEIQQRLFLLSLGAFGVGGGALNFSKAKKMPNQPPEPTAASGHGSS
jgi:hypothetical protein